MSELENLKAGDQVIMSQPIYPPTVETIERETKCYFIVKGDKYNKQSGRKIGSDRYYRSWINPASPDQISRIQSEQKHRDLCAELEKVNWKFHPLNVLENINGIIQKSIFDKKALTPTGE